MTAPADIAEAGHARFTFRLRVSSTSREAYKAGEDCGPAGLDRILTGWRAGHAWLGAGGSVPQQQAVRDFAASRAKALKDVKARLPARRP